MLCYAPTFYSKKLDDATGSYVYRTRTRICTRADRELEESLKRDPLSRAAYAFAYYIVISLPAWGGARNVYFSPVRRGKKIEAKIEFLPRDRRLGDILTPYPWRTDRSESAVTLLSSRGRSTAILTTIRAHANKCTVSYTASRGFDSNSCNDPRIDLILIQ